MEPAAVIAPNAPSTATINDLPDDLLGRVLALAGRSERASVTLVSRRFHRLFYSEPSLWRSLDLGREVRLLPPTEEVQAAVMEQLPLLRRVAGVLQHLSIHCEADGVAATALSSLQPATLPSLQLSLTCQRPSPQLGPSFWEDFANMHLPASMAATFQALTGLTGLTRLVLLCDLQPRELPAALCMLPNLSSLLLSTWPNSSIIAELGPALQHLAPRLTHLGLGSGTVPTVVAQAMGTLAQLRRLRLRIETVQPDVSAAIIQLTCLEALWLESRNFNPSLGAAAEVWAPALMAGQLPQLSSVRLCASGVLPMALVQALVQQTQLTELTLEAVLGDVRSLAGLTQLRRLTLCADQEMPPGQGPVPHLQLPPPHCFPALEAYWIGLAGMFLGDSPDSDLIALDGAHLFSSEYAAGWSQHAFEFALNRWAEAPDSWNEAPAAEDRSAGGQLTVTGLSQPMPPLDQLAAVLLPPGASLHRLQLDATDPPVSALLGSSCLAALHYLGIEGSPGILRALPQQLPHLTSLEVTGTAPATGLLPDQLPSLPALLELQIARCIDSSGSSAIDACMPALLSRAPQLTSLIVWGHLSQEDAEELEGPLPPPAWLASLQGVQALSLFGLYLSELPPGPYLEGLEYLSLDDNVFEQLPQCLAAATSLIQLSLSSNRSLTLTEEDVEQVLARMPGFRHLFLYGCPTDQPTERLLRALPELHIYGLEKQW